MAYVLVFTKLAGVLALILLNAFFVAAEYALVRVRSTQIEPLALSGERRAALAHHITTHLETYLSATQLGVTLTSLALGWLGEPFFAHSIESFLHVIGVPSLPWLATASVFVGFGLMSYGLIVLGELCPRWFAIQNAQPVALAVARPLHLFYSVFRPFIWMLNRSAALILNALGLNVLREGDASHTEEEMRLLLSRGRSISSVGRSISLNAIDLRSRTVREVMVPRTSIVFLSTRLTVEENITRALDTQFTRYPLCEKELDNILGMIHLKDLFRLRSEQGPGTRLLEIKREMLFVPETMALDRILNTFLTKRNLMAVAVDEYGGTAGLITLENVLEELVGDINDEFDTEPSQVRKVRDGEYLVEGSMSLYDFARMFDVVPTSREVVTVSGYVIHLLGKVPERGATLSLGRWMGVIDDVEGFKVKVLRLRKLHASDNLTSS